MIPHVALNVPRLAIKMRPSGLFFIFILSVDAHVVSDYWDKAYLAVTNNNRLVSNCTGQSLKLITIVDSLCFLI